MKLHEYQAKDIFCEYEIPVPEGYLASNVEEAVEAVSKLGGGILKAQVLVGGRGKDGGIRTVKSPEDAGVVAGELFGSLIKGHLVQSLLVEQVLDIEQEMYLSFILDKKTKKPTLLFSTIGGINIEDLVEHHPESLYKITYDCLYGLQDFQLRKLLFKAGIAGDSFRELFSLIKKLNRIAIDHEAELVEINPLVKTGDGLYAADAVLIADDNALFRHGRLKEMQNSTEVDDLEREARLKDLSYVRLDGNIGVIANGAGLAMTTMDMIFEMGGRPANFLDTGGGLADPDKMKKCMLHVLKDPRVSIVYINIYAEITRCEKVAQGIVEALGEFNEKTPLIVKLTGVNEDEGKSILLEYSNKTGEKIIIVDSLEDGAEKAVRISEEKRYVNIS